MLTNLQLSELLARVAESDEELTEQARKAYKRAARYALSWTVPASQLKAQGLPLTELKSIGPYLAGRIDRWLEDPPAVPEPPPSRQNYLSRVEARELLFERPWPYGDLHSHTHWSDGKATLMEMATAAEERGYNYLAITDHAKNLKIAGGLSEARLAAQGVEIAATNAELAARGFRVRLLRSSEINFDPGGQADYSEEILMGLDFVIGAFHSKLRLDQDQTERYLAALCCPGVDVLAHPQGRVFNFREGLKADWNVVCRAAALLGKALEIDGIPDRQDMSSALLVHAVEHDVWISLGSDAHNTDQLHFLEYALAAALKAGVRRERILNLLSLEELLQWRHERIGKAAIGPPA